MITLATLREHLEAAPFKPFAVRTVNGKTLLVDDPKYVWIPPESGGSFHLANTGGRMHHLDVDYVELYEIRPSEEKAT